MQNNEIKMMHYEDIHYVACSPVKILKINNEEFNYYTILQQ